MAVVLGLLPHPLDRRHHIALLGKKRVPEISSPLDIADKPFHHIRNGRQRLNAWVPRLFRNCVS
jgi:hypothetical protein